MDTPALDSMDEAVAPGDHRVHRRVEDERSATWETDRRVNAFLAKALDGDANGMMQDVVRLLLQAWRDTVGRPSPADATRVAQVNGARRSRDACPYVNVRVRCEAGGRAPEILAEE
jgi:hypothetical protein